MSTSFQVIPTILNFWGPYQSLLPIFLSLIISWFSVDQICFDQSKNWRVWWHQNISNKQFSSVTDSIDNLSGYLTHLVLLKDLRDTIDGSIHQLIGGSTSFDRQKLFRSTEINFFVLLKVNFNRGSAKKYFPGTIIQTHNLLTCVLAGIDHFHLKVATDLWQCIQ